MGSVSALAQRRKGLMTVNTCGIGAVFQAFFKFQTQLPLTPLFVNVPGQHSWTLFWV
jgi:hypothetical protein